MTQQPLRTPEREITSRNRCDAPVQGDGLMSYHCSLPIDHERDTLDKDDPQPCYTVDSSRSARVWSAWKVREEQRQAASSSRLIACPSCRQVSMEIDEEAQQGTCRDCGAKAPFQTEVHHDSRRSTTYSIDEVEQPGKPWKVLEDEADDDAEHRRRLGLTSTATTVDPEIMEAAQQFEPGEDETLTPETMEVVAGDDPALMREDTGVSPTGWKPEHEEGWRDEMSRIRRGAPGADAPTKQREGDQQLPAGGDRVVQDWVMERAVEAYGRSEIDEDQYQQILATMQESKRVGTERYGQPLKTFDGRLNIKDIAEEARDFWVYLSKMQMMAEADRPTLVRMVAAALRDKADFLVSGESEQVAEIAVDRILDWVLIQRIGPEQVLPIVETPEPLRLLDGCVAEHSPGLNPDCIMREAESQQ